MSLVMVRLVRLLAVLACGVVALLVAGVVPAFAETFISHRPEGIHEEEVIADNFDGNVEREVEFNEPAGKYAYTVGDGPGGAGAGGYEEYCEKGNIFSECEGLHKTETSGPTGEIPKGYTTLSHVGVETDYMGKRAVVIYYYAWKPTRRHHRARRRERFGMANQSMPNVPYACESDPVNCATGNEVEAQTDISIPALGVPFVLERTYNSQAAVEGRSPGLFGYGWSSSFGDHLEFDSETGAVTVVQANGSTAVFFGHVGTIGELSPPSWSQAKLVYTEEGTYKYTLPDQETFTFNASGRLLSESERNGNVTTVSYSEESDCEGGCHEVLTGIQITDPAGRKITLAIDSAGQVESATDPMGHIVHYGYEAGDLVSVTGPGESSPRWRFKYNGSHEMTEMVNGLGGKTTTEYNAGHQVVAQTSPLGDTQRFEYEEIRSKLPGYAATAVGEEGEEEEDSEVIETWEAEGEWYEPPPESQTTITNETTGAVEKEHFNDENELMSVTHAAGTPLATTEEFTYNSSFEMTSRTDGDKHRTEYGYDSAKDRTSETNADGDTTEWEYDSDHDVTAIKTPDGEKTTIERDGHGNAIEVSRPAPGETSQVTKYKYAANGELESMTNPLGKEWKYEYDGYGDRAAETDPEGDRQTWLYNEDSQLTSTVSPRGHASGAKESSFTTTIERDAQGQAVKVTNPLGQTAKYVYNADGDVEAQTDPTGHTTSYSYNAEDEPTKIEQPNGAVSETGYNALGQVTSQTNGDKQTTKYTRNLLGETTEEVNPLSQKTTKEYDAAGNLTSVTDAEKRTTSYKYDPANRLIEVTYSDGKTPTVKYEYNGDGERTKMADGTGETIYTYDQLDRLTEAKDGRGDTVKYEYNLDDDPIKITYPNGKAVTRMYDNDGRLKSVTDWLEHTTSFAYNPDSELTSTTFPSATGDKDTFAYDDADDMSETEMVKGSERLASLVYTRNEDEGITKATIKGLPGEAKPAYTYDTDSRLSKGAGTEYEYDDANNITGIGKDTYSYNAADEIEKAAKKKTTEDTYSYNEVGQRTKTNPASGPATSYGYDQAGDLISVARPAEGEKAAIEDTYAYNGEDLRTSQTVNGTTSYLTWDTAETDLPLILNDGTYNYIYGPEGLPIEQINSESHVQYLHHDEQGSTRLITGETGKTEGAYTYTPYGAIEEHTGTATTPLDYDAQYRSSDTGLVYMRARTYDPATAQFLSVDPLTSITREPYTYGGDSPLSYEDPSGAISLSTVVTIVVAGGADLACGTTVEVPGLDALTCGAAEDADSAAAADLAGDEATTDTEVATEDEDDPGESCETLRHYTNDDGAAGIGEDGLIRQSEDGYTYMTPDEYGDGDSAQEALSLPRRPTGYFEVPVPDAPEPEPVPPRYGQPGGGTQVPVPGPVNVPPGTPFTPF